MSSRDRHSKTVARIFLPAILSFALIVPVATPAFAASANGLHRESPLGPLVLGGTTQTSTKKTTTVKTSNSGTNSSAKPLGPIVISENRTNTANIVQQQQQQASRTNTTTEVINLAGPIQVTSSGGGTSARPNNSCWCKG
jgi:hypothetical protein